MTQTYKYIIVDSGAILFNEMTTHAQVAEGFIKENKGVYSAGFVKISFIHHTKNITVQAKPYGESVSLKIKSNPTADEMIILDLYAKISQIKYFGLQVKNLYKKEDDKG